MMFTMAVCRPGAACRCCSKRAQGAQSSGTTKSGYTTDVSFRSSVSSKQEAVESQNPVAASRMTALVTFKNSDVVASPKLQVSKASPNFEGR